MRKYNIIYGILFACLITTSCENFLDTMPDNRTEVDSKEKITALLVSAYPRSTDRAFTETSTDNVMDNGSQYNIKEQAQEDAYFWNDITSVGSDSPHSYWGSCYLAIASANLALESIASLGNPENLNAQKGEALMCRAYGHFALANTFCLTYNPSTADTDLGIPYAVVPESVLDPKYDRGNMADLYAKINEDIEAALPLINDAIYSVPKYHFNVKAAHAFAARFNLYYLKYDKVIEYADVVLGSNPANFMRDWKGISVAPANYTLRANMYISADESANLLIGTAVSSLAVWVGNFGSGTRFSHGTPIFEKETIRADGLWGSGGNLYMASSVWQPAEKNPVSKTGYYFEYTDKVAATGYSYAVPVIFSTNETLLCRAEAYALKNNFASATADINTWIAAMAKNATQVATQDIVDFYSAIEYMPIDNSVRTIKKKLNPVGFIVAEGEQENMIQCILHLRRIETIQEGLRWNDIKRYGIEISHNRDRSSNSVLKLDDPRRAIQLPQDVISSGLTANPRN